MKRQNWVYSIVALVGALLMFVICELLVNSVRSRYEKKERERLAEIVTAHIENLDFGMILPEFSIEQRIVYGDYVAGDWDIIFSEPLSCCVLDSLCHADSTGWSYELVTLGHGMGSYDAHCYVFNYSDQRFEEGMNRITIHPDGKEASLEFWDFSDNEE